MPQTLLCICALIAFSLFALNQHRSQAHHERAADGAHIEMAATDVARDLLARIGTLAFDQADFGSEEVIRTNTSGLSTQMGPDPGEDPADARTFNDVDDYNGFAEQVNHSWHGRAIPLYVEVSVRYVNPALPTVGSSVPTLAKEVAVTVRELVPGLPIDASRKAAVERLQRAPVNLTLRQVITPTWRNLHG